MKYIGVLIILLLLSACKAAPLPALLTETRRGEPMIQRTVEKTGPRRDVPVNKKPREVMAQSKFSHQGGTAEISITKGFWPWSEVQVSTNCMKCHKEEPIPFTRPKDPWWKWPGMIGLAVGIALAIFFLDKLKGFLFFWRK